MNSKRLTIQISLLSLLATILLPACGNYSNDDLDFQLALPEQSDMEAKMQLSITRVDSAEYYRATRTAITTFNGMVVDLVALIDLVRGATPTSRHGDERTWGPFPSDKAPGWEIRVVMQRSTVSPTLLHMDYWLQLRQVGQGDSSWVSFLIGKYTSGGSARTGQGEIHLVTAEARAVGYPVDSDTGLANLDHLDVTYDNTAFPITVTLDIVNLPTPTTQAGQYQYFQNQNGSGQMSFDWQGVTETGAEVSARMQSEWIGSGAGRADLTVDLTPNLPDQSTTLGTDCWGVDTVATYSFRLRDEATGQVRDEGSIGSCLFLF
jgi:hypothetical protein